MSGLWFALKGLGLGFGVYLVLYLLRAMGAGDVKLMAAVGSIVGASELVRHLSDHRDRRRHPVDCRIDREGRLGKTLFNVGFILSEMKSLRPAYLKNEELDVKSDKGAAPAARRGDRGRHADLPRVERALYAVSILDLFRLDGKTALVTGARRGLGKAMAIALAEAGADIVATSRTWKPDGGEVGREIEARGRRSWPYAVRSRRPRARSTTSSGR